MIADFLLIIFMVALIYYSARKGCIKIISKIASVVLSFVLAYMLAEVTGSYISNETKIGSEAKNTIKSQISNIVEDKTKDTNQIVDKIENYFGDSYIKTKEQLINRITNYIFIGIGFVLIFIATRLIIWIISIFLDKVFELPILNKFNKAGGILAGFILFLLDTYVILAIIHFMSSFDFMQEVVKEVQASIITCELYNHNILVDIIMNKLI